VRLIDGVVEAKAPSDLLVARIPQRGVTAANQHRHIGAHEDLAQLGIGLYEGEQLFASELDHLTRLADAQAPQRPAAGDHVALARELPGPVSHDQRLRTV
jgi:hypothetical protein